MLGHQRVSEGKPTELGHQSFAGLNHLFACVAAIRIIKQSIDTELHCCTILCTLSLSLLLLLLLLPCIATKTDRRQWVGAGAC